MINTYFPIDHPHYFLIPVDPRFDHFEDPWKDAKPALSINLHDEGFSFDNQQGVHYHYDSNTRVSIFHGILSNCKRGS